MELKDFEKYNELCNLRLLLDKYPFDFIMEAVQQSCIYLSREYEKEKNFKLADCFQKDVERLSRFLNDIEASL